MENDKLLLVWNDENGSKHSIGELSRQKDKYCFQYSTEIAAKSGNLRFGPIVCFPKLDIIYESKSLFPVFRARLPDKRRPDIAEILEHYGLNEYEPFELLKSSGGRLPTDHYEFLEKVELKGQKKNNF